MRGVTMSGPDGQWPQEQFVDPLTGEPIPSPSDPGGHPTGVPSTPENHVPAEQLLAEHNPSEQLDDGSMAAPVPADEADPLPADQIRDSVVGDTSEHPAAEGETTPPWPESAVPQGNETPPDAPDPVVWPEFAAGEREPGVLRRNVFRISITVGAVLLVIVFVLVGMSGPGRQGGSALPPYPTYPSFPPLTLPPTQTRVPVPPSVPGWQGVAVPKYDVAYDVPPDWKVETPGTIVGHEDPTGKPLVVMSGVSTYKDGFCTDHPYSYRAHLGFSRTDLSDPAQAARNAVQSWADAGYSDQITGGSALVTMSAPTKVPVDGGRSTGTQVTGLVAVPYPRECDAPNVMLNAVAAHTPAGLVVCLTEADQDAPAALSPADLSKIVGTIRPLHR